MLRSLEFSSTQCGEPPPPPPFSTQHHGEKPACLLLNRRYYLTWQIYVFGAVGGAANTFRRGGEHMYAGSHTHTHTSTIYRTQRSVCGGWPSACETMRSPIFRCVFMHTKHHHHHPHGKLANCASHTVVAIAYMFTRVFNQVLAACFDIASSRATHKDELNR